MKKFFGIVLTALLLWGCARQGTTPASAGLPAATETAPTGSLLTVTYLDVGQADCAVVECDGAYMVIDGGNVSDSDLVVRVLMDMGVETIHTVVATHAHEDHVGGLAAVLAVFPTEQVYCSVKTNDTKCFRDFAKYAGEQDLEIRIPEPGERFSLGSAEVTMLGPVREYEDINASSIVLRVDLGENAFLFTGDSIRAAEKDLLASGQDVEADVLKVGHHGSYTSSSYEFLEAVDADYAVISCQKDNEYGHPHMETEEKLDFCGMTVFRTDTLGTVTAVADGQTITFTWEKTGNLPEQAESGERKLIGNKNSLYVHLPYCDNLPKEKNRVYFDSLEEAVGYTPCSGCMG